MVTPGEKARNLVCPKCGATDGVPCMTSSGRRTHRHSAYLSRMSEIINEGLDLQLEITARIRAVYQPRIDAIRSEMLADIKAARDACDHYYHDDPYYRDDMCMVCSFCRSARVDEKPGG